jgi:hypothetical protein
VALDLYPRKLASLNLDLALAPLEHNRFNEAKSNLRILEYGALGWPVIASDIQPYRNAPVRLVNNSSRAWINAIREHVSDPTEARRAGDHLKRWVKGGWMLQLHRDDWIQALNPARMRVASDVEQG